ncbi:MAG: tRNA (adenosine(37)-N6)-threonylcarbamoyltransferase complex transferase subunit TsaD [Minisyncoccia bacterium]
MNILSIETSCDETAISIVNANDTGNPDFKILGNTVATQIELHAQYGGVFPMMAKREHSKNIIPVLIETLKKAGIYSEVQNAEALPIEIENLLDREPELLVLCKEHLPYIGKPDVDVIVVTSGPGLEPALWVGVNFAKVLGMLWGIPVVPVNHMEGHIMSPILTAEGTINVNFPALALLISGGHTELVLVNNWMEYKKIGQTRDDAVGEAFDKVARMMNLPYPGGPQISKLAEEWRSSEADRENSTSRRSSQADRAEKSNFQPENMRTEVSTISSEAKIHLPRPMLHSNDYDFSFSGLKTAVLYAIQDIQYHLRPSDTSPYTRVRENNQKPILLSEEIKKQIACEFENAATEVLLTKTFKAIDEYGIQTLLIGGGVAANKFIKKSFMEKQISEYPNLKILLPEKDLSTDNALMIAIAGYYRYKQIMSTNKKFPLDFKANGNWDVSS